MKLRDYLSDLREWWSMRPPWMFNRPWWEKLERYPLPPNLSADVERALRDNATHWADNIARNNALLERLKRRQTDKDRAE